MKKDIKIPQNNTQVQKVKFLRISLARKKNGIIITIIPIAAVVGDATLFIRKKVGTPNSAATLKQISCLFVILNITLLLTFVRSRGTEIYDAAMFVTKNPFFCFRELLYLFLLHLFPISVHGELIWQLPLS